MILMMDHHENQDDLATAAPSSIMILMISLSYHIPVRVNGLARTRDNDPTTYGATASDMGISIGAAWRAQVQLQRIGAIRFDPVGQMVPALWE